MTPRLGPARWAAPLRRGAIGVAALVLACALWELYKLVGPDAGAHLFGASVLPRSDARSMPHVWDVVARMGTP
ncbi:MAG TPA: ABC transporter permease, partial [Cellulomonas sp.]|nr:ABC transporter permease [Cellulomonas sp.]